MFSNSKKMYCKQKFVLVRCGKHGNGNETYQLYKATRRIGLRPCKRGCLSLQKKLVRARKVNATLC